MAAPKCTFVYHTIQGLGHPRRRGTSRSHLRPNTRNSKITPLNKYFRWGTLRKYAGPSRFACVIRISIWSAENCFSLVKIARKTTRCTLGINNGQLGVRSRSNVELHRSKNNTIRYTISDFRFVLSALKRTSTQIMRLFLRCGL